MDTGIPAFCHSNAMSAPVWMVAGLACLVAGCAVTGQQFDYEPGWTENSADDDETSSSDPTLSTNTPFKTAEFGESDSPNFEPTSVDLTESAPGLQLVSLTGNSTTHDAETNWTLQALQQLAIQNNPAIKQASAAASGADGIHNQTGLRPNPTAGLFAQEIGNDGAAGLLGGFVSQTFVRGDKLEWNELVVGHEVQMRRWTERTQRQKVLTDIELHFITALAAQQRLELTHEFRKVAAQGVKLSEERVEARFAGRADLLQSEVQLSQVDLSIQQTELEIDAAWSQLAAVVGIPNLPRHRLQGRINRAVQEMDLENSVQNLLNRSPQISTAQYRVSRARANLQRQQAQKISNVTAQVGAGHDDATGDTFANLQLSVPVPVHNKNQGNIHAAWAEYCEATQDLQRLKMQLRHQLAAEQRNYLSAAAAVEQYREVILPRAKETLDLMKQARDGGEYDFLRVLTARRAFFDASINYVSAMRDFASADARINGMLLTGGLNGPADTPLSTGLRGQALSQQ